MGFWDFIFSESAAGRKGAKGERKIETKLKRANRFGFKGVCLQNLYAPLPAGGTTEIDLVYLTPKGLFVIESKNYSGLIYGDEADCQWTAAYYQGRTWYGRKKYRKYFFYNPLRQNETHIRALRRLLGSDVPVFSFVVFGDEAKLKKIRLYTENAAVCRMGEFSHALKCVWRQMPTVLSEEEIEEIYRQLLPLTQKGALTKIEHIGQQKARLHSHICPVCGGRLVLRTAKRGPFAQSRFYGCENYPRCRYTRDL